LQEQEREDVETLLVVEGETGNIKERMRNSWR